MKNREKIVLMLIIAFFLLVVELLFLDYYVIDIQEVRADFKVKTSNFVAFNLDKDALHFGTVPPKGHSIRNMTFYNYYNFPVILSIKSKGDISDYISASQNNFVLEPNSSKDIAFTLTLPSNIESRQYNGTLKFYYKRDIF